MRATAKTIEYKVIENSFSLIYCCKSIDNSHDTRIALKTIWFLFVYIYEFIWILYFGESSRIQEEDKKQAPKGEWMNHQALHRCLEQCVSFFSQLETFWLKEENVQKWGLVYNLITSCWTCQSKFMIFKEFHSMTQHKYPPTIYTLWMTCFNVYCICCIGNVNRLSILCNRREQWIVLQTIKVMFLKRMTFINTINSSSIKFELNRLDGRILFVLQMRYTSRLDGLSVYLSRCSSFICDHERILWDAGMRMISLITLFWYRKLFYWQEAWSSLFLIFVLCWFFDGGNRATFIYVLWFWDSFFITIWMNYYIN